MNIQEQIKNQIIPLFYDFHEIFKNAIDLISINIVNKDHEIKTACVHSNEDQFFLTINEEFWKSLDFQSQCFVFCHEMLHIVLGHLNRFYYESEQNKPALNLVMDIVINHFLTQCMGFERYELYDFLIDDIAWVDTVFEEDLPDNESTEFYWNRLPKKPLVSLTFDPFGEGKPCGALEEYIDDKSTQETLESLENAAQQAGISSGGLDYAIKKKVVRKKPWESIIRKWVRKKMIEVLSQQNNWGWPSRKFNEIQKNSQYFLKGDQRVFLKKFDKGKNNVAMFLDASGSCIHLKNRFFSAAASIPTEYFNVELFSFDTSVHGLSLSNRTIRGGGGTRFDIIEKKLQLLKKYPDIVFIITDGYGNNVNPDQPEKWYWFLTRSRSTRCIPKNSKIFNLENYA